MTSRYKHYQALKAADPKKYARDLAAQMAISEAEMAAARCGHDARSLKPEFNALLAALGKAGETKSITRNEYAVHLINGRYENLHSGEHAGMVLNPRRLDLRLLLVQWGSAFALQEMTTHGERHSIQFFDHHGDAVLKIYATAETNMAAWQAVTEQFAQMQPDEICVTPATAVQDKNSTPDNAVIEQEWRVLTDIHHFFRLLKRHNLTRQQVFNTVPDDLAVRVANQALPQLLQRVKADGNEIMIFVGNRGCTQIFTGIIANIQPMYDWLNIFSAGFALHLRADQIAESWVTRKPGADGFVTSLELFAADGTQIAQLYGQRVEGEPEQTQWRAQLAALTEAGIAA